MFQISSKELIRNSGIDFFSSSKFPSNSPDLNMYENIDSILKDCVEEHMGNYNGIPCLIELRREVTGK